MKTETTTHCSRQFPWLASALLGLLIISVAGCANVPAGSDAMKQQALSFSPPPGKAGLYIIRPYQYRGSILLDVISLDYEGCGSLADDTYLFGTVFPGEHTLRFSANDSSSEVAHFTAEAGKSYYFTVRFGPIPLISGRPPMLIEPISETDGQKYVRQFKLSGDNRFQFLNSSEQTK